MPEWKQEIRQRLARLKLEPTREAEIIEELAQHLDDRYHELRAEGVTREAAARTALAELRESEVLARELRRVERRVTSEPVVLGTERRTIMGDLWQDLRYGVRTLAKQPGFTVIALLTLALGIGANTAIFSVVNAVLLKPLPYPAPARLMLVRATNLARGLTDFGVSMPDFRAWRDRNSSFATMAAFNASAYNVSSNEAPERVIGAVASVDLFATLGVNPAQGRAFSSEEEQFGKHRVVILSSGLWQRRFGAEAQLDGQTIKLNGEIFTIVGVMPRGFQFPDSSVLLWLPLAMPEGSEYNTRGNYWLSVVGRLKPGVTEAQAQSEMDGIQQQLEQEDALPGIGVRVVSLHQATVGNVQTALLVLLGAVLFVLLIACVNVANLLLARAASRHREIAVRTALGAARSRIIRQLLTESVLLGLLGGVAGLLLAWWGVRALVGLEPNLPRLAEVTVDGQVLAFTFALALLTSLIFGLAPALQATRGDLNEALKEGGRSGGSGARTHRIRNVLVVAEIALALVLLVSAGLMINSLLRLQHIDPGFRTDNILTMQIALPEANYPDEHLELAANFYRQLTERVATLPGVQSVGMTSALPLTNSSWGKLFSVEGRPMPQSFEDIAVVQFRQVNADYFEALAISLIKGRAFTPNDTRDTLPVAVINEAMARRHFAGVDPSGKRVWLGPPEEMIPPQMLPPGFDIKTFRLPRFTIVGVIKDVRYNGLTQQSAPEIYTLHEQTVLSKFPDTARSMYLAIRTTNNPLSLTAAVRRQVQEIDKEQPIADVATMEQLLATSLSQSRLSALLLLIFAGVALALASVGIYGVMSYSVTERTHEIGIRMALGAARRDVLWLVIKRGMMLVGSGVLIGLAGALGLTRLMASLLFDVSTTDPMTFTMIALLLAGVALVACYVPARRATKVDPMIALRYE